VSFLVIAHQGLASLGVGKGVEFILLIVFAEHHLQHYARTKSHQEDGFPCLFMFEILNIILKFIILISFQTQKDCENPLRVSEKDFPGFCLDDPSGVPYLSQKNRSECLSCGGVPQTPASWRKGKWLPGNTVRPIWK
jgi:hypothetical protein